jgi:hypothetical protein
MSRTTRSVRRTLVLPALALPVLLLTPSAASADPPALNRTPCADLLALAAVWPGDMETPRGTVRLVSDAYVRYLEAQPPCTSPGA